MVAAQGPEATPGKGRWPGPSPGGPIQHAVIFAGGNHCFDGKQSPGAPAKRISGTAAQRS